MLSNDVISVKYILNKFNISRTILYDWIKKGIFPASYKMGHRVYWKKSEIEEFMNTRKKKISDEFIDKSHVLNMFEISQPTLYNWMKQGVLPKQYKICRRIYWKKLEIEEFIKKSKTKGDKE